MTFFNRKEDVIKIELTPHGRKLLSEGKLMPSYYSFFDDDILYDSQRGGFSETSTQTKTRILSETPYMKPQTNYKGVDSRLSDARTYETENHMISPIGTNKFEEIESNGWSMTFLHNTASSADNVLSASDSPTLQIPQVNSTIEYTMRVSSGRNNEQLNLQRPEVQNRDILIEPQQILMHLIEKNGFNFNESLELEIFLYEQDQQTYKKLNFEKKPEPVVDEMYIEKPVGMSGFIVKDTGIEDTDSAEFWFKLGADGDIPDSDRCSGIKNLGLRDIYLDMELNCPDLDLIRPNIYATSVQEIEDCEE